MISFTIGLDILSEYIVVLCMLFLIIMRKIKVDSYDSLPLEKILTLQNVIKLINSVFDKDKNNIYFNIFLENGSCQYLKLNIINRFLYKSWILYVYRIDTFERIDVNKTSESKQCNFSHYWIFFKKRFKFQSDVCNGYHDVLMMSLNFSDIAFLKIHGADYHCIISIIIKSEAMKEIWNIDLTEKSETL